eukprot:TRINITY_DN3125_c0_g1_i1.p1 TRINITY_DN3125_c0_g1~~TRINITY_DN3125_c0_g1_i1.p1  ORF type:complete len:360 (-),score=57.02 TRINITY_DN3125_c0_g1_i1:98-1177(-)
MDNHVLEVREANFYSTTQLVHITIAIGIVIASIFLRGLVANLVVKLAAQLLTRFNPDSKKQVHDILAGPLEFTCLFAGLSAAGIILRLPDQLQTVFQHLLLSFLNIIVFWILYRSVTPLSHVIQKTSTGGISEEIRKLMVDSVKLGMVILGFLTMLQAWGVDVAAFLAGLGLAGMAVALAAQDTLKNLFASITVFADESFKKGDWIKTPAVEGIVERVSVRTTTIRKFDTSTVIIPNGDLVNATITNFTPCSHRKVTWSLPIGGGATRVQLLNVQKKVNEYIRSHKDIVQNNPAYTIIVALDEFGENCVKLFVFFYTVTPEWIPFQRAKQDIILGVKSIIETETNGFGVPTRHLKIVKL